MEVSSPLCDYMYWFRVLPLYTAYEGRHGFSRNAHLHTSTLKHLLGITHMNRKPAYSHEIVYSMIKYTMMLTFCQESIDHLFG